MPAYVPQDAKADSTINAQPKDIERTSVQAIMMYDLCGYGNGKIAEAVGLSESRTSLVRSSPLYKQQLAERRKLLAEAVIEKRSDQIVEDPVLKVLHTAKIEAAEKLVEKMSNAKNEFLQAACAKDVLNFSGYTPEKKTTVKTIEVTADMANRFEAAIRYTETRTRGNAQPAT